MVEANYVLLSSYLILVFCYTLLAYIANHGKKNQSFRTLVVFTITLISPLVLVYCLAKLYVYLKDTEVKPDE